MNYKILILRRAQKELASIPEDAYRQIKDAIMALKGNPRPFGCKKLLGREGGEFEWVIIE